MKQIGETNGDGSPDNDGMLVPQRWKQSDTNNKLTGALVEIAAFVATMILTLSAPFFLRIHINSVYILRSTTPSERSKHR